MKEQPILGYDWEMGHEEIKLEIGTYYTGKGLYIGMLAKEDGAWKVERTNNATPTASNVINAGSAVPPPAPTTAPDFLAGDDKDDLPF